MKELSIEEKVKAYDEALKRAKDFMNGEAHYALKKGENIMCWIFPELRESEDEEIRKEIITYLSTAEDKELIPYEDWIAWLEKQGENGNHTTLPKFTFDDVLALQCCMKTVEKVQEDKDLYKQLQSLHDRVHDAYSNEKQDEQKIQPKFEVGDVMRTLEEANSGITDGMPVVVSIDDKYYRCNNELIAIKDQDDYEYPPMNRKQESSEWSEEDENRLDNVITQLKAASNIIVNDEVDDSIEFIKSLKERIQLKVEHKFTNK